MLTGPTAATRARWEVLWVKDKKVHRHGVGSDLAEGLRIYGLALQSESRTAVTLRCCNISFPPPDKYADREEVIVVKGKKRYKGTKITEPKRYVDRMSQLNLKGIFWCGYCMKMRKLVKRDGYSVEGKWVADSHMACPMCGTSHRMLVQYNPMAQRFNEGRIANPNAKTDARARRAARRKAARAEED